MKHHGIFFISSYTTEAKQLNLLHINSPPQRHVQGVFYARNAAVMHPNRAPNNLQYLFATQQAMGISGNM